MIEEDWILIIDTDRCYYYEYGFKYMKVAIPFKLSALNLWQMRCLAYRYQCKISSQNFQTFLSLKITSNVRVFCFQTVSESDWSKGKLNRCLEVGILMNKQGTEAVMRDVSSSSSRHVVDFQAPVSGCSVSVLACPERTVHNMICWVRIVCSCWVCSQATCGAVCLRTSIPRVPVAFWCSERPSLLCVKRLLES